MHKEHKELLFENPVTRFYRDSPGFYLLQKDANLFSFHIIMMQAAGIVYCCMLSELLCSAFMFLRLKSDISILPNR